MKQFRIFILPFSALYAIGIFFRNLCYDLKILRTKEFDLPVISVGNLTYGGSGKTPHMEYLIHFLQPKHKIAALSRGYGRKTSGFILADENSASSEIGDEPKQFKKKFPEIPVSVDTSRVRGINKLQEEFSDLEVVLMDDAFQHRSVVPGLNILLTDYGKMYYDDILLPAGTLREFRSGSKRADIIIVTKTPPVFSPLEQRIIFKKISPLPHQRVYFSYVKYGNFIPLFSREEPLPCELHTAKNCSIILFTGVANATPLVNFLKSKSADVTHIEFRDHHPYSLNDIQGIKEKYNSIAKKNKIILTTEKDVMRIEQPELLDEIEKLPVYYVPIKIAFHSRDGEKFNKQVFDFIRSKYVVKRKGNNSE